LYKKRQHVAADEDLGQPCCSDGSEAFTASQLDESAEDHVDGCCEESGGEEESEGLQDVNAKVCFVVVGECSTDVPNPFD